MIYLIGFMGSGKSTIAKELSKLLSLPFSDTDKLIEMTTQKSIINIFKDNGDNFYQRREIFE